MAERTHGKKWAIRLAWLIAIAVLIAIATPTVVMSVWALRNRRERVRTRYFLLQQVDHDKVVQACKKLMSTTEIGHSRDKIVMIERDRLPSIPQRLEPTAVFVEENCVSIECAGGFWHQGFLFYADKKRPPGYKPGHRDVVELGGGLWYYETE